MARGDFGRELDGPVRKRTKTEARYDERAYVPGALMKVRMHNFMTHKDVTFEPGPRLNVVLGPNGTGKSAFVCAVCVGLGGSPNLLGRAGSLGDFVKRGEESAYTEITLRGREVGRPIVVRRDFKNRAGGQSVWKLNGVVVKHEQILKEMKGLNMQLDNLCSFLPQDRVVAFSMLNPQELLMETEKAIGNAEMYEMHDTLKQMKNGIADLERSVDQKTTRMVKLERDNESLERDVKRLQEREELITKADDMAKKIPWLKFDRAAEEYHILKNAYTSAKEKVNRIKADHGEKVKEYKDVEEPYNEAVARIDKGRKTNSRLKDDINKADAKFNKLGGRYDGLAKQLSQARRDAIDAKQRVEKRLKLIEFSESQLDNLPQVPDDIDEQRRRLREAANAKQNEIRAADDEYQRVEHARRPVEERVSILKKQKNAIESVRMQKIEQLSKHPRFNRIKDADEWVQRNKQTFHGEVLGPLLAEIEVNDPTYAGYVEQHLGLHALATFIVTDQRDERSVSDAMKQFGINVWTPRSLQQHVPGVVSADLQRAGVVNTLDNVFKAKSAVKRALNDTHRISRVLVGNNTLNSESVNQLFRSKLADQIYCPSGVYVTRRSRYDASAFTMSQAPIRQTRLFVRESNNNINDIKQRLAEAEAKLRECTAKSEHIKQVRSERQSELQRISKQRGDLNKLAEEPEKRRKTTLKQIEQHKLLLADEEKSADFSSAEKKIKEDQHRITAERVACAMELFDTIVNGHEAATKLTLTCLESVETSARMQRMESSLREIEEKAAVAKAKRDDIRSKFHHIRDTAAELKQQALNVVQLTPEIEKRFEGWPNTVEELEHSIDTLRGQADAILCHNPAVLDEFNKRRAEMTALTRTLETEKSELAVKQQAITMKKEQWLPQLQKTVQKISEQFQENFARIGCAGQVNLSGDGSRDHNGFGDDFKQYSLEIRVKFRANEDMHLLDAHRQSGGERSVTTMLYMIALQAFTSAPFRVVDEINQGMDARNERKVFKRMVDAASAPGTPQCFVITPKLLTQLEYSEDCTVMCIFNGPHVHEMAQKWHEMQHAFDGVARTTLESTAA